MVKDEKKKYENLIVKTINHLEKLGYTDFKADIEGYESPRSFEMRGRSMKVTPDIVSRTPNGKLHYVDVSVKTDEPVLLKTKWKFLETLAEIKNRSFRIITHRGHYSFTDKLLGQMNLTASSLKI